MARMLQLHLDEPSGTSFFNSAQGQGSVSSTGSPTAGVSGIMGNAVSFIDQTAQRYIAIPIAKYFIEPTAFTAWCWVYITASATNVTRIMCKSFNTSTTWTTPFTSFRVELPASSLTPQWVLRNGAADTTIVSGTALTLNTWHMLAFTMTAGGACAAYLDGAATGTTPNITINYGSNGDWLVGGDYNAVTFETVTGRVDEVNIDDTVFTPTQILAEYNKALNFNGPQLVTVGFVDDTHVTVNFLADVDHTDGATGSHFTIPGLTVGSASYNSSKFTTTLTLSTPASRNTGYTLTVAGVRDVTDTYTIGTPYNTAPLILSSPEGTNTIVGTEVHLINQITQVFNSTVDTPFGPQIPTSVAIQNFFVVLAGSIDGTHVKIIFNKPPVVSEALTVTNYAINHGLGVLGVSQETNVSFILTTTPQSPGTTYTLTLSGIHDLNGDPI